MKKTFILLLTLITLVCFANSTPMETRAAEPTSKTIEMLENGYYYETIIVDVETEENNSLRASSNSITKKKTTQFKNSSGTVLWSVSITATFTYDGSTSKCTSCTPSAKAYASTWSIKSVTSSKSGNSATATAVATQTGLAGITYDYTKSVTIKCSATGVVS